MQSNVDKNKEGSYFVRDDKKNTSVEVSSTYKEVFSNMPAVIISIKDLPNNELIKEFKETMAMYEREGKNGTTKSQLIYEFDVRDNFITATYEQCSG